MTFWDFYAAHPAAGTFSLVMALLIVDSIGVDIIRTVAAWRAKS